MKTAPLFSDKLHPALLDVPNSSFMLWILLLRLNKCFFKSSKSPTGLNQREYFKVEFESSARRFRQNGGEASKADPC